MHTLWYTQWDESYQSFRTRTRQPKIGLTQVSTQTQQKTQLGLGKKNHSFTNKKNYTFREHKSLI